MSINRSPNQTIKKAFLAILIVIILVIAVVGIIIASKNATKIITNGTKEYSTSDIIKDYSASITNLASNNYNQQINTPTTIKYKSINQRYEINILSNESLLFSKIDKSNINDLSTITEQTEKYMIEKGFEKSKEITIDTEYLKYSTFENNTIVCQLASSEVAFSRSFSCTNKSDIEKEYTNVNKLLDIYKQTNQLNDFNQVSITEARKDNCSYSVISLKSGDKHLMLLFGLSYDNWEYIGDLINNNPKYTIGKYTISPEMKVLINNPKYNGFLASSFL